MNMQKKYSILLLLALFMAQGTSWADCSNSCSTGCSTGCSDSCSFGCSLNCSNSCSSSCSSSCTNSCGSCSKVSVGCSTTCADNCSINCSDSCSILSCSGNCHSKTHFTQRQITYDSAYELALSNYHFYHVNKGEERMNSVVFTPFYQESTKSAKLGQYFLPNCASQITLDSTGAGTINPEWFGLTPLPGSQYRSVVTISPRRKISGVGLNWHFDLAKHVEGLWIGLNTTVAHARTDLRLQETLLTFTGTQALAQQNNVGFIGGISNACSAFSNPALLNNKLSCKGLKRTGLDDIQLKLGYDWYYHGQNHDHWGLYGVLGIPTARKTCEAYLFEPTVGSQHASLGLGLNGDVSMQTCRGGRFAWMLDVKYRYVFSAKERRSFDLTANGDWSRYLLLQADVPTDLAVPAVNSLTQNVSVKPGSTIDLWTALHGQMWDCFNLEVGYNFWWRQAEHIDACAFNVSQYGISNFGGGTASAATIASPSCASLSNASFTALTSAMVNRCSAAHPRALSHKVYGAIAYDGARTKRQIPVLLGFGSSYEFAQRNTALEQWAIWGKIGVSF